MSRVVARTVDKGPDPFRRLSVIIAISLVLGLAGAAISYLASSLAIPGPGHMASTQELRQRGAELNVDFCKPIASEPRFWPECIGGGAAAWRERGATALVAYCPSPVPDRMLSASDCLSQDRPAFALTHPPRLTDASLAGIVAAASFVLLGLRALAHRFLGSVGARHQ
jgi:hypothetical protein